MSDAILTLPPPPADIRVPYESSPNQFIDLRFPRGKGPFPLLVNIHGGFWRAKYSLDHAGRFCAAFTARGLATANVEYRRVGDDGGGWPNTFADVCAAYQFVLQNASQHTLDLQRVVVTGHSAGGQLALCLAAHELSITRVVSLAGVVDLQRAYQVHLRNDAVVDFLGGTPTEVPDHYYDADPMQLSIPQARQWLIHGADDDVVPPAFSRDYVAARRKTPRHKEREDVRLLEIPRADHFDLIDPRSVPWKQVEKTVLGLFG
jgi:acetyl esterase/lipase